MFVVPAKAFSRIQNPDFGI